MSTSAALLAPARWVTPQGVELLDLVPAELRTRWSAEGHYPDQDIYRLFAAQVGAHPDRDAVISPEGTLSYLHLSALVDQFAATLERKGVRPGEVVGIRLPNGPHAVAAELAAAALGAVALTFPAGHGSNDAFALLRRSRATAVLTTPESARELTAGQDRLPFLRAVLTVSQLADASAGRAPASPDPNAPARILVSSGSESEPKMVAYSHNAMAGGRGNYLRAVYAGTQAPRILLLVPLSSSYGSLGVITLYRHGGTLILLDGFDPAATLRAVTEHRPTHLFGVATMLRRMTAMAPGPDEDLSSLRSVIASCDGLPAPLLAACLTRFGCLVSNLYGSTDGLNCRAAYRTADQDTTLLGIPDPAVCELRISDPAGGQLPAGEAGEVWARGPMSPLCYVGAPQHDARYRAPGGWVRSGDHGRLTAEGRLQLLRRNSQLIKRGGYSISPAEVERHAGTHPDLAETACVPVPDPDLGERLCICVVPRPDTAAPTLAELNAFLEGARGLERRKLPEQLLTLEALPLGATGKLSRTELTTLAAAAAAG